jgi:hypothetical protein
MTIMTELDMEDPIAPDPNVGLDLELEQVVGSPEEEEELPWGDDPSTATWAPMMAEVCKNDYSKYTLLTHKPRSLALTGAALLL